MPDPRFDQTLVPREVFFGNPERVRPTLAPDGKRLAFLAPLEGVLNVYVAPVGDLAAARAVTADKARGIRAYAWAENSTHLLYFQDKDGDENWRAYAVEVATGKTLDLTPFDKVQARLVALSHRKPNLAVMAINDRVPEAHDLYQVDILTGDRVLLEMNEQGFLGYGVDDDLQPRLAEVMTPDGGKNVLKKGAKGWETLLSVKAEDAMTTHVAGFDEKAKNAYLVDSTGRDLAAAFSVSLADGKKRLLAEGNRADVDGLMVHPTKRTLEAVSSTHARKSWFFLDKAVEADFQALRSQLGEGELEVASRTRDDKTWVVDLVVDNGPVKLWLYDRKAKKATFLFSTRPALEKLTLARMHPRELTSRDGLTLLSYLTLPPASDPDGDGKPAAPVPMVLLVHGGPWYRDTWGLNGWHQWLASRGYAVLSVNFRGSTGLGKAFVNASNKEWAGKMHDDLLDAVDWAIKEGVAPADKIAIMGGSYGGYATLVGLTFTPERFACGVDIVGPSSLTTLLATIPPYWKPMMETFTTRVGDPRTPEGQKLLEERSPLTRVGDIARPLLIGQGANDPRVKQAESDQIVKAMEAKGLPLTYVLFPDEGHGFARPENRLAFNAVTETFLSQCLGGVAQPVGDDLKGSSIQVPAGVEQVEGLADALARPR
jgi:dipeptidyl aminopeptidase/acylaminoacyl peptidase